MIEWKSVYDELPKGGIAVLAIVKNSDAVFTLKFDPTYGWESITGLTRSERTSCSIGRVQFWAEYNLPK